MMTGRQRILSAIRGEPVDSLPHIPISMMIASDCIGEPYGRYATEADVHARGQMEFTTRWDIDHVSAVSDPATEAADLGARIVSYPDQPPAVDEANALLQSKDTLLKLRVIEPGSGKRMGKRLEVIRRLKEGIGTEKLIEGWLEGPMAESADLRGINTIMMDLIDDPDFVRDLMSFVVENALRFAREQIRAGADIIGVGDAAASLVGPDLYRDVVRDWEKKLVEGIHGMGALVRLHICGNTNAIFPFLSEVNADIVDLDSMAVIADARKAIGKDRVLSGNIDPVRVLQNGTAAGVTAGFSRCLAEAGGARYAVNAGCEIPRGTPVENLKAMMVFARSHRE